MTQLKSLIFFGRSGNYQDFPHWGWRFPEEDYTWSVGDSSSISIPLAGEGEDGGGLFLVCNLAVFALPEKGIKPRVKVRVCGIVADEWLFHTNDFFTKVVRLPEQLENHRELDVVFETPDALSPAELGLSTDSDLLGVCMSFLSVATGRLLDEYDGRIFVEKIFTLNEFNKCKKDNKQRYVEQKIYESVLAYVNRQNLKWYIPGRCDACNKKTNFEINVLPAHNCDIPFRELLICKHCGLNNRQRMLASYTYKRIRDDDLKGIIYLYEQYGNLYKLCCESLLGNEVVGSEFLGDGLQPGELVQGVRHENALALSFADNSVDVILSCDVFEHVSDINKAMSEAYRILSCEGTLVFTIPFNCGSDTSQIRAVAVAEGVMHLLPSVYHGNPIDSNGSLVFYDFGWDIMSVCYNAGFRDVYAYNVWGASSGYLGSSEQFLFVANKTLR